MLPLLNLSFAQSDDTAEAAKPDLPLAELQMFAQVFGKTVDDVFQLADEESVE